MQLENFDGSLQQRQRFNFQDSVTQRVRWDDSLQAHNDLPYTDVSQNGYLQIRTAN